jgi:hypothetical protein
MVSQGITGEDESSPGVDEVIQIPWDRHFGRFHREFKMNGSTVLLGTVAFT